MVKEFDEWNIIKKRLNASDTVPFFKEREVWWTSLGVNIGHEEDGKNQKFNRPVLVVAKFNSRIFWGVPLTTKIKNNAHYHRFNFRDRDQCAMLTQMRLWDANRLTGKIGRIGKQDYREIREALMLYLQ